MDRYIKMLMAKLSQRYRITLVHITSYNPKKKRLTDVFTLDIRQSGKKLHYKTYYSKRDVVLALAAWEKAK
jgi:hypothetical protein